MSTIKFLVLLTAVMLLLPADKGQQERLWKQSKDIASWVSTTCDRNPQSCETAQQAWLKLKDKSTKSTALMGDMVLANITTISIPDLLSYAIDTNSARETQNIGTLQAEDMIPNWRGHLPTLN